MLNKLSILAEELKYPDSGVTIYTDRRDIFALRDFLKLEEKKCAGKIRRVWKRQAETIKKVDLDAIIETRSLPQRTMDTWANQIGEFVAEEIYPVYFGAIETAGNKMARRINRKRKQAFEFDSTSANCLLWVNEHGGKLIVQLTAVQYKTVHALLSNQVFLGITSPYQLSQMLKPLVGLTAREATAVLNFQASLVKEGLSADIVASKTAKYQSLLHRSRASRIARTELSNAYNFGQQQSIIQALDAGFVEGEVEKTWLAGGSERMCEECEGMDGEAAPLDQPFSCGLDSPPLHPQCRCSVGYRSVRRE